MSGLDSLNKRLQYRGGNTEGRMKQDKLGSLKSSLFGAYQAETAILEDGREFKCLINPNKETTDYDNKVISIPYQDICLNPEVSNIQKISEGREVIGLKTGDTFTWKETDTHWLVYLEYLEEDAYFRAQIRRCDQQIEVNGKSYWVYIRGPVETSITWNQKTAIEWNDLNYSLVMFITQDENTANHFKRFTKVKVTKPGTNIKETWQVVGVNPYYGDGIVQVFLDEYNENSIEEAAAAEKAANVPVPVEVDKTQPYIDGPTTAVKYDTITFVRKNFTESGNWYIIENGKETKMNKDVYKESLSLDITKSKGTFTVKYKTLNEEASIDVTIKSF